MEERTGRFRVYRVVESVPHINLFDADETRLYTAYQSGYGDRQADIDALRTGDLVEATLAGDPEDPDEAWSIRALDRIDRIDRVRMAFAVGAEVPAAAEELWTEGQERPSSAVLKQDGEPVAELVVQPRAPLPGGAFVPSVLTGLVPMEESLTAMPTVGDAVTDVLFLDPDTPDASGYSRPFGVVVLFGPDGESLRDEFYAEYGIEVGADTRPDYDPYGI